MQMMLYVIMDNLAGESGPVFEAVNNDVAARKTRELINETFKNIKEDMSLLCVGTIDHEDNKISSIGPVEIQINKVVKHE